LWSARAERTGDLKPSAEPHRTANNCAAPAPTCQSGKLQPSGQMSPPCPNSTRAGRRQGYADNCCDFLDGPHRRGAQEVSHISDLVTAWQSSQNTCAICATPKKRFGDPVGAVIEDAVALYGPTASHAAKSPSTSPTEGAPGPWGGVRCKVIEPISNAPKHWTEHTTPIHLHASRPTAAGRSLMRDHGHGFAATRC